MVADVKNLKVARTQSRDQGSKEAILSAALECFARFGFEGTSMSAVARTAGVTQLLMHYYFESKDELWRAAMTGRSTRCSFSSN